MGQGELAIATACIELAEFAISVFDNGFQSARGDSAVAISSSLAGASGALGVVYLNLASFRGGKWAKQTRDLADQLSTQATSLQRELDARLVRLRTIRFHFELDDIRDPALVDSSLTDNELAEVAMAIHRKLPANRHQVWKTKPANTPKDFFDPRKVLQLLGYEYRSDEALGQFRKGV
ncbi:MAG: hypothetical protein U5O39_10115 [Gammaproteobacteria bacterium]|nr:hypothetical protein [Gammaproteobacteria bacterium]